ncbi:MAG: hypothetical protein CMI12_10380 [Oceanospirillum sp.]|nr:hypothetical protein [Oceanospirillum sp.]
MVLSNLALIGIIQLVVILGGAAFFLFLYNRFLKKQIKLLKQGIDPSAEKKSNVSSSDVQQSEVAELDTNRVTGEISELRKMLDEKLLLTANMRKLIEAASLNPDDFDSVIEQQNSTLHHLEEYINHSRKEASAVEDKVNQYREQLAKAKRMLSKKEK